MARKIIVPATSANLGAGFDSLGLAVNLYLEIEVQGQAEKWQIEHQLGPDIASDASNLIIQTALSIAPDLPAQRLKMSSNIPLEHGLGSSSSAIVAGIKLACLLMEKPLDLPQQLALACQIEGHPDNVVPALLGGLQVASYDSQTKQLAYSSLPVPACSLLAFVPDYNVSTQAARAVLPTDFARAQAVLASSKANVLIASLASRDLHLAGQMMESDLFHEKYRQDLIPELGQIRALARSHGAFATYLSGAGSTIMSWLPQENVAAFTKALQDFAQTHPGQILQLQPDLLGARIVED